MDFTLPDELVMLQQLVRNFVKKELLPLEEMVMKNEASRGLSDAPLIPADIEENLLMKTKELGLWGLDVPEEFGGTNLGFLAKAVVMEELGKTIVPFTFPPDAPNLHFLISSCNSDQKERYLLPYVSGKYQSAIAISEPNAGSDIGGMQTRAVKKGDKWVINGTKTWISNANNANFFITMAVTDPEKRQYGGITAFIVDKGTPGLKIARGIPTIGSHHPYEVYYDNVEVDESQVLGEIGNGFIPMQNRLGVRRIEIAQRSVGMSERLLEMMSDYSNQRKTFGKYLAERQAIQWWVANSAIDIHATRLMSYHAAWKMDNGVKDIRQEAAMLKVFGTEMSMRIADRAMQLHGAMGLSKELPIEFMYRNIRALRIIEGASEIHRWTIARDILKNKNKK
ncbi:acyl-CoA dehydrogenase family protein [Oceanobacillus halophilus]|uniref:Medium-chain specific acyl-CoA dehydrogenase, mitochondrial n=1 Tax=Oceanobacillus halophilus TaxID=930130 RepID=A0A495A7M5_9BACI|nr:acyl-CoA dehydrogenase family protein [Oceanobacillus halophilus]RKQ35713.1 acyl-CoA dehydrogenase [Oceanobacillus halophilus]